jgi:hypothetical protein
MVDRAEHLSKHRDSQTSTELGIEMVCRDEQRQKAFGRKRRTLDSDSNKTV